MPHPDWEDLTAFFDPADFATVAVITRGADQVAEVFGIFDDPTTTSDLGEYQHDHPTPTFLAAETDLAAVEDGDTAVIEGRSFDVMRSPENDGTGVTTLILAVPNVVFNAGI